MINWIKKNNYKILWIAIALYIIIFSLISWWKYDLYLYNGLDLAIFNQTFYNTAHGNWFGLTIHPPSYLGDHFTPIILLLLPFYYLGQSPLNLLALQTVFLALGAWPVFKIAQKVFKENNRYKDWLPLVISIIYLANPVLHNVNLYEFHLWPIALFFLFWIFYFYYLKKFWLYIIFIVLSLLVREDISLIIFMFGVLALIDRRRWKWWLVPAILSVGWFIGSMNIINYFSLAGSYKFVAMYQWLGNSFPEMIINFFPRFDLVFQHFLRPGNFLMVVGLLTPFFYISLLKPKYLLLALPSLLQICLSHKGGGDMILHVQHSLPFIFAIVISFIFGFYILLKSKFYWKNKSTFWIVLVAGIIYLNIVLGPIAVFFSNLGNQQLAPDRDNINEIIESIPPDTAVVASYKFLAPLSSRKNLASLNYVFFGKQQFGVFDYTMPVETEYLLLDSSDPVSFYLHFLSYPNLWHIYKEGDNRLSKIIEKDNFEAVKISGDYILFKKDGKSNLKFYEVIEKGEDYQKVNKKYKEVNFLGYKIDSNEMVSLYWEKVKDTEDYFFIRQRIVDQEGRAIQQKLLPFNYGLYPLNEWSKNKIMKTNYWWVFSDSIKNRLIAGDYKLDINIVSIKGGNELNRFSSVEQIIDEEIILGEPVILDIF